MGDDPEASDGDNPIKSEDKARTFQGSQCLEFVHTPDLGFTYIESKTHSRAVEIRGVPSERGGEIKRRL